MGEQNPESVEPQPEYKVGFGKPPKHTQFQPGQSGNSKGRPPGRRNARTEFLDMLNTPVTVTENGKRRKKPLQEVVFQRLGEKAVKGDPKAMAQIFAEMHRLGAFPAEEPEAENALSADEQALMQAWLDQRGLASDPEGEAG